MARSLRGHHDDIEVLTRNHLAVVNVEAVGKSERRTLLDVRLNLLTVGLRDVFIRDQHHDDVSAFHGIFNGRDCETGSLSLLPGSAVRAQTDHHIDAGVMQVQRMGVSLGTVADDRDLLALDDGKVTVLVVINLHAFSPEARGLVRWKTGFGLPVNSDQ